MLAETAVDVIGVKSEKASQILQQLIGLAKEGVKDTRQALRELRAIEESAPVGLKAIYHLAKVFEEVTGVRVDVDFGNLPWIFHKELEQALYRMIQEGLTNAFRHGKASEISIRFWIFNSELIVRIYDNGQGAALVQFYSLKILLTISCISWQHLTNNSMY
jgi:signal transduction histidine kinase